MGYPFAMNDPQSRPRGSEGSVGTAPVGSVEYATTAPDQMARANAAQAANFAANPVSPRGPVQSAIADQSTAVGFGVQPGTDLNARPQAQRGLDLGGRLSEVIDERTAALKADRAPVVTPQAAVPRPPQGPITGAMTAGSFSDARYESQRTPQAAPQVTPQAAPQVGPVGVARGATMPAPMVGTPDPNYQPRTVESMRQELALRNAQEKQDLNASTRDMRAAANAAQSTFEMRNAQRAAEVSAFGANNSILNQDKYGGRERKYTAADFYKPPVIDGNLPEDGKGVVTEAIAVGESMNRNSLADDLRQRAGNETAKTKQELEVGKLKLDAAKQMAGIHAQLLDPKLDPKEHARLSSTLLSMLGKDKPEEYKVMALELPGTVDPNTGAAISGGKAAVVINSRTGEREIVRLDASGKPDAKQAEPKIGQTMRDANGSIGQYLGNGKWKTISG